MPNGRPGDSVLNDIVGHRLEVLGPSCDRLVRDIARGASPERLRELRDIIEPWVHDSGGGVKNTDMLFHRLAKLRDEIAAERRATRRPGRAILVALLAFFLGGPLIAIAAGILAFVIGAIAGASQFEGAFAMGVASMMPVAGLFGGAILAVWLGWRSWRG